MCDKVWRVPMDPPTRIRIRLERSRIDVVPHVCVACSFTRFSMYLDVTDCQCVGELAAVLRLVCFVN